MADLNDREALIKTLNTLQSGVAAMKKDQDTLQSKMMSDISAIHEHQQTLLSEMAVIKNMVEALLLKESTSELKTKSSPATPPLTDVEI